MKTPPFFRHVQHVTGMLSRPPVPERYPFHDNSECSVGQEVKRSGDWQYYAPATIDETRPRCAICIALNADEQ